MTRTSVQQSLERALQHHRAGQVADAARAYEQVLSVDPDNADALHLLGLARHQAGDTSRGAEMIERAIRLTPDVADFHANLAMIHAARGNLPAAAAAMRRAVALRPGDGPSQLRLAGYLRQLGRAAEAIEAYRAGLRLRPDAHAAAVNLGVLLIDVDRPAEALPVLELAARALPESPEALANLGLAFARLRRYEEAVAQYERALVLKPDLAEVHTNLGAALLALGRAEDAARAHRRACELRPGWVPATANLAIALGQLGETDEALALHEAVLRERPDDATSLFNRGLIRLATGNFAAGWRDYESRFRVQELKGQQSFPQPRWEGQDAAGKTVLVHAEQGLGDTVQFVRYVPRLLRGGARVVLQCDPLLVRLLRHSFPDVPVLARGEPLPEFDFHEPIMSLPFTFGTLRATIPAEVPYLSPPPGAFGRGALPGDDDDNMLHVGIVWSGSPGHYNDRNRSIPLDRLLPALAAVPGVRLFSLQKGPGAEQLATPAAAEIVTDLAPSLNDLADTAAAIRLLDLTVCVDTSVAHLAGALAAPVWTLLPEPADFRWLVGRDDSPWYPTMRLFRQSAARTWDDVLARLTEALAAHAGQDRDRLHAFPPRDTSRE